MPQALLPLPKTKTFISNDPFLLEGGSILPQVEISYTTQGVLNADKSNVVWVFHALTGNADPTQWWPGLFGTQAIINLDKDFMICANVLGSCYGTTGPTDFTFPRISVRDMVSAHQLLKNHLDVEKIKLGIGGSLGGQQLIEWAVQEPSLFENINLVATNAQHSPWGIAFNEAQRMALNNVDKSQGLAAARAIAMLSYRHYNTFESTQKDEDQRLDDFSASSYQQYQGFKLDKRFTNESYHYLSKAMDSHNVGRHGLSVKNVLQRIKSKTLVIGINTDILFPIQEQQLLADNIPNAKLAIIKSNYGHDGFLVETDQLNNYFKNYFYD